MENKSNIHPVTEEPVFYRFPLFHGVVTDNGGIKKTKTVGMAYLKDGTNMYTLRLWTLLAERYYLITDKDDPSHYLVMVREPNRNPANKNKYYWNVVGTGQADPFRGLITLEFDLLSQPIYINIHPAQSPHPSKSPEPDPFEVAS